MNLLNISFLYFEGSYSSCSKLYLTDFCTKFNISLILPRCTHQCVTVSGVNHTEGGWPREVRTENAESKNKFIRKLHKDEMFKYTTLKLAKSITSVLIQNQTLNDIEETYYDEEEEKTNVSDPRKAVKIVAKFKDFSKRRRPVSHLSWLRSSSSSLVAVSHCSSQFLGSHGELVTNAYVCDIQHTAAPRTELPAPGHVTVTDFNDKHQHLLAAGCYSGSVCFYDTRCPPHGPSGVTTFEEGHRDPVFGLRWVGKAGHEFLTGSQDGLVKGWDIRNFGKSFREFLVIPEGPDEAGIMGDGVSCLTYEQTIPSNFMIGTDQGRVVTARLQSKLGSNSLMMNSWKVRAVHDNVVFTLCVSVTQAR